MMLPRRICSTCKNWNSEGYTTRTRDGYIVAVCLEPADERDHKHRRGSDYCSKWDSSHVGEAAR